MTTLPNPLDAAVIVARVLDEIGVPYTIGGSIASSMAAEPRSTIDIHFVVSMDEAHIARWWRVWRTSTTSARMR